MIARSTVMLKPLKMLLIRSWVSGRSFGVSRRNIPMTAPMLCSTWITKTFSSLPTKMAQPLLAGRIPRISTGTTSFFIPTVYGRAAKKQVRGKRRAGDSARYLLQLRRRRSTLGPRHVRRCFDPHGGARANTRPFTLAPPQDDGAGDEDG